MPGMMLYLAVTETVRANGDFDGNSAAKGRILIGNVLY
jgi:hypothetical protein